MLLLEALGTRHGDLCSVDSYMESDLMVESAV